MDLSHDDSELCLVSDALRFSRSWVGIAMLSRRTWCARARCLFAGLPWSPCWPCLPDCPGHPAGPVAGLPLVTPMAPLAGLPLVTLLALLAGLPLVTLIALLADCPAPC